uniref:Uncharacterized protein n=1 Tax=Romanomermis culicivorax TaxID=13658 RepID=A0A915HPY4_ROMCU
FLASGSFSPPLWTFSSPIFSSVFSESSSTFLFFVSVVVVVDDGFSNKNFVNISNDKPVAIEQRSKTESVAPDFALGGGGGGGGGDDDLTLTTDSHFFLNTFFDEDQYVKPPNFLKRLLVYQ